MLSKKIFNNIKKYSTLRNKKTLLNNIPKELVFNITKYNPTNLIRYLESTNITIDFKSLYYFFFKENSINSPYTWPNNHEDPWMNAIINRNTLQKHSTRKNHLIKLLKNGKIMTCGNNDSGQLGLGPNKSFQTIRKNFKLVKDIKNIKLVSAGRSHTIVLAKNKKLFGCGRNLCGQLGLNNTEDIDKFKKIDWDKNLSIKYNSKIKNIFCGLEYTVLLLNSGKIMVCGINTHGQLGINNNKNCETRFVQIKDIEPVHKVFCQNMNTILLLQNGQAMISGGIDGINTREIFHKNKFEKLKDFENNPICNIANIFPSEIYVFLLLKSGEIMSSGNNEYGQLGQGNTDFNGSKYKFVMDHNRKNITGVKNIFILGSSVFLLFEEGKIMACGDNSYGKLGVGDTQCKINFQFVCDKKGNELRDIISVHGGYGHTVLLLKTGEIMVSGKNAHGQLGLGDNDDRSQFELVTTIKNIKEVYCGTFITTILLKNGEYLTTGYCISTEAGYDKKRNKFILDKNMMIGEK